jgi:activator of HSP90 ATPase
MTPSVNLKSGNVFFSKKNFGALYSFIFCFFFIPHGAFSQTAKPVVDSSGDISIHHEIDFKVAPQTLYRVLLSSTAFSACTKKSFSMFSDHSASIDSTLGGAFSVFDGHIVGRIVELVPNRRIVEAWRVVDWPEGKYSIARFELTPNGAGTHLSFEHVGFPQGLKEHLSVGWQQHYWDALKVYFQ